jgi:two-component system sensor histidine kinase PilS (NtrC family)
MAIGFNARTWLEWLVKVRIIIITFLLAIELAITTLTTTNVDRGMFVTLIVAWYAISIVQLVMVRFSEEVINQSRMQILTDLCFSTAVVYVTGGIDTSFNFLYPLIIIVASILLSETWAYLTAAFSFILFGALLELSFFGLIHSFSNSRPDIKSLQAVIFINLFAYIAIAYLAGRLSNRLRQVNVELQDKSGALQDLQALHENIVNSISGGLITTDLAGRIEVVNPAVLKLLEREEGSLLGRRVAEFFTDPVPQPATVKTTEIRTVTPFGTEKTFGMTVSQLTVADRGIIGLIYTFDDLTEIRRLEREIRLRERLAAVGRLASGIAHEIRNPLSSIAGSVKLLTGVSALNNDQRELLDIVTRESERLNNIITDFLVYSREKHFQMRAIDLVDALQDTLTLLENSPAFSMNQESSATIKIIRNFKVVRAPVVGDGDKLKQVFWNICENSVRAIKKSQQRGSVGAGMLTVTLGESGGDWLITFADTGAGMSPQQVDKIFEPFQSAFEGGTGLGLAIVYQIVQAHQGKISVRSEPGRFTEFTVRFSKLKDQIASAVGSATAL